LRHGLLKASFIPPEPIRELRELTRCRTTLIQARTAEINRLHKVLESANIKLGAVASEVLGASGRALLDAILVGERDPEVLAELAKGRLRQKLPALRQALTGRVKPQHLVLLERMLAHIDFLDESIQQVHQEIERCLLPFAREMELLQTIPGVAEVAAGAILAEIGVNMSRFPSAKHLAAWAGVCPGNRQSGGKRLGSKTREGNTWLRGILGEVAWAISHKNDTYLSAQYHRLARRRGKLKAVGAVAHSVLVIAYHVLAEQRPYHDLGRDYFERLDRDRLQRHHVHRLEALGYEVSL
jgi:transposase